MRDYIFRIAQLPPAYIGGRRGVLADKDGTVTSLPIFGKANGITISAKTSLYFLKEAEEGLALFARNRIPVHLVSNQGIIGERLATLEEVTNDLEYLVKDAKDRFDLPMGFSFCQHPVNSGCECRKPKPYMALDAISRYGWDKNHVTFVGDYKDDIHLGRDGGLRMAFLRNGLSKGYDPVPEDKVWKQYETFSQAARDIIEIGREL